MSERRIISGLVPKKKKNLEKGVSCGLLFIFIGGCSMSGNILILYACIPKVHTSIVKQ